MPRARTGEAVKKVGILVCFFLSVQVTGHVAETMEWEGLSPAGSEGRRGCL